jgi:predicted regulator of Ras-like GTPase activity (Roadblock/LC7/MglB family)
MARQDILQNQIESLCKSMPELSGALLASNEGLPIACSLTNNVDPNWLAVIASTGASLGRRMGETMGIGALAEMSFGCAAAKLFLYSAGSQAVLVVVSLWWTPFFGHEKGLFLDGGRH